MHWKKFFDGLYAVSDEGVVISIRSGRELKPDITKCGYEQVTVGILGKSYRFKVHRLVAEAFIGPCPAGLQVNHKDAVKGNNRLSNLEYVTCKQNAEHASRMGRYIVGSKHYKSRLTEAEVLEIRRRYRRGNGRALGAEFGIAKATVNHIVHRNTWKHI